MEKQLKIFGILHKLNLATWSELRQIADKALNQGIYAPALVDTALDADAEIYYIGMAFMKALSELEISIPQSKNQCLWLALQHYIKAIAMEKLTPYKGLSEIMTIFYGCKLYDKSRNYVGDSHDIHHFIGYFWTYNELQEDLNSSFDEKKQRTLKLD